MKRLWGGLAAGLLLALIWCEFWQSRNLSPTANPTALTPIPSTSSLPAPFVESIPPPDPTLEQRRWEALRAEFPYLPPPLSLDMKQTTLEKIVAELNSHLGTSRLEGVIPAGKPFPYTVTFTNKTYGEALLAIDQSNPIMVMPDITTSIRQLPSDLRRFRSCARGPFFFSAEISHESQGITQWPVSGCLAIDPRLTVLEITYKITAGPDDKNQTWAAPGGIRMGSRTQRSRGTGLDIRAYLDAPPNPGTRLSRLTMQTTILVQTSAAQIDLENAQDKEGQQIKIGDATVVLKQFHLTAGTNRLQFELTSSSTGPSQIVDYSIVDAAGQILSRGSIRPTTFRSAFPTTGSGTAASVTPPITLHLEASDKIISSNITFELLDLPIPQPPAPGAATQPNN